MQECSVQVKSPTMAAKSKPGNDVYQLRAVLRGISPLVWRRLLVRAESTVADLHEVLQVAFGWEDMHLNRFEIHGREYGVYRDSGPLFTTAARKVRLCDLQLRRLDRFVYGLYSNKGTKSPTGFVVTISS